ncbi:MAG TPA: cell division protein FtsL [Gammaproteobacteria bacterium]|nr:cell division protein FtsL [Gammaproteobacteria bacterium]
MSRQALEIAAALALAAGVVASGIWIVEVEHRSRQLFIENEALNRELDRLQTDWGRLQIEQGTYATHSRIEGLARQRLQLTVPSGDQLVVVVEPARSQ